MCFYIWAELLGQRKTIGNLVIYRYTAYLEKLRLTNPSSRFALVTRTLSLPLSRSLSTCLLPALLIALSLFSLRQKFCRLFSFEFVMRFLLAFVFCQFLVSTNFQLCAAVLTHNYTHI